MYCVRCDDVFVFLLVSPADDGHDIEFESDVTLDDGPALAYNRWRYGDERVQTTLGQSPDNPKEYRTFADPESLKAAGFIDLGVQAHVADHWQDFLDDLALGKRKTATSPQS